MKIPVTSVRYCLYSLFLKSILTRGYSEGNHASYVQGENGKSLIKFTALRRRSSGSSALVFTYFARVLERIEGQLLCLLLWRPNSILNGDLFWWLECLATHFLSVTLFQRTQELQHTSDEQVWVPVS